MEENLENVNEQQIVISEEQETRKPNSVDEECAGIANALMEQGQQIISMQKMNIDKLQNIYNQTGREDVLDFITDIKNNCLSTSTHNWEIAKDWFAYFEAIDDSLTQLQQGQAGTEQVNEVMETVEQEVVTETVEQGVING